MRRWMVRWRSPTNCELTSRMLQNRYFWSLSSLIPKLNKLLDSVGRSSVLCFCIYQRAHWRAWWISEDISGLQEGTGWWFRSGHGAHQHHTEHISIWHYPAPAPVKGKALQCRACRSWSAQEACVVPRARGYEQLKPFFLKVPSSTWNMDDGLATDARC